MWRGNKRAQSIRGFLKSFFASPSQRRLQNRSRTQGESLEQRLVLSAQYVPNHVLVGLESGYSSPEAAIGHLADLIPGTESRPLGRFGVYLMKLPQGRSVPSAIGLLQGQPGIRYAEPDWIGEWSAVPNDPDYNRMWAMSNTGQTVNGVTGIPGADVSAESAWDISTGSTNVIAAIVDSGTDYNHPDLARNMWVNAGEIAGNGVDDDSNGYVDDVRGFDFADGDSDPMDFIGHGTHVTGTVGAVGDNSDGTVGVNWNVSLMACKIGGDFGGPVVSAAIEAIDYAVAMGAVVSNHSYSVPRTQAMDDAITAARSAGHIVVCAAGNSSFNNDFFPQYPASFRQDNIISVAATDQFDDLAGFSNFGVSSVDIGAPGVNIWSTTPQGGSFFYQPNYDFSDGTSMASPMVTGAVALLRSVAPGLSYDEIIDAIYDGADPTASLSGRVSSGSRLNISGALLQLQAAGMSVNRATIAENDGSNAARLTIRKQTAPIDQPLTVDVIVSDSTELVVGGLTGTSVTIPAFQRQIVLPIDAIDDTLLDGTQSVTIVLRYQGTDLQTLTMDVTDHETITVTANPTTVFENAGVGAGTLTIARSNTDIFPADRVIAVGNELVFFNSQGAETNRVPVPWPTGSRSGANTVRDITAMEDGRIAVFNGVNTVYISLYNPGIGSWTHQLIAGASASTADSGTGGISTIGSVVYISDLQTSGGDPYGIVRYDTAVSGPGAITRVGNKAFGDRLFGSSWPQSDIYELDPATGAVIRTFTNQASGSVQAGVAFDGQYVWYIVDNNNTLYKIDSDTGAVVDTFAVGTATNGSYEGIAYLNGLIYLLDGFITDEIVVFDPVLRTVTRRLPVGDSNISPGQGGALNLSGGLTANPARNSLFVSSTFGNEIYEVSATSGLLLRRQNGSSRFFLSGVSVRGMATVGDKLYVSETTGGNSPIRIFDFDGNLQGSIPGPFFFSMYGLGGDGVPGIVDSSYRWRDATVGLDGFLYALEENDGIVGKFDLQGTVPLAFIDVGTSVQAIAVDSTGTIYAGRDDGSIVAFSGTGVELRRLDTTLGVITDVDVNVSGDILAGSRGGAFAETTIALQSAVEFASGVASAAFVSFGEHFTKNSGELVVQLSSSDTTELVVPVTVVIPEGQQSVDVPFDAIDDFLRDGLQVVVVDASAAGYVGDTETVFVEDFEGVEVEILNDTFAENAGLDVSLVKVRRTDIDGPFDYNSTQQYSNPQTFQLRDRSTTLSPISVPTQISRITDINVTVNFRHDWIGDLDVFLVSPSGRRVELFTDLNSNERNITRTVLDDEATLEIVHGSSPYTGSFMPEGRLSDFDGEQAVGTWYLEVTDDNVNEFGTLLGWSLELSTIGLSAAVVQLRSQDPSEVDFGGSSTRTVTIPANQSEVTTFIDAVDDDLLDGTQVAVVAAESVDVLGLILGGDSANVTDVEVLEFIVNRTRVSESDGVGAVRGTLRRSNTDLTALDLEVTTSNANKLNFTGAVDGVPFFVRFDAGSATAEFTLDAIDNSIIDGNTTVQITVVSPQYGGNLSQTIIVEDQEPRILITTTNPNPREDAGTISVTIQRADGADLSVQLDVVLNVSGSATALIVPPVVSIPQGFPSITIPITVVDDTVLGDRAVTITGTASNFIDGVLDVTVLDYETVTLTVSRTSFLENAGARAAVGTVTRSNTDNSLPLIVNLSSSDTSELTVPAFVTIPGGAAAVSFDIAAINDPNLDGPQLVTVSASAVGYAGTNVNITVLDHEPPVLTAPAATTVNPRETIRWNPIPGAVRYDLQLANLSLKIPNYIFAAGLTTNSFTPPENLGIANWRVWVRAYDQLEVPGFWSLPRDFRVVTAPTITAPTTTGLVAASSFPDISWTAVADAVRYELWVNNLTTGAARVIYKTDLTSTTYRELAAMGSGTFRAFARAANSVNEYGNWSAGKEFTVLAPPTVTRPEFTSTFDTTPLFQWTAVVGAKFYDLYVSNRTTGAVVLRDQAVIGTSRNTTADIPRGDYSVWVRAVGDKFLSAWSPVKNFSIGGAPTLLNPAPNAVVSANHTFSWTTVGDAGKYEIWVERVSDRKVFYQNNIVGTSFRFATPFTADVYRVWLRAVSVIGDRSVWSAPVTFSVAGVDHQDEKNPEFETLLAALPEPMLTPEPQRSRTVSQVHGDRPQAAEAAQAAVVREFPATAVAEGSQQEVLSLDRVMEDWSGTASWLEFMTHPTGFSEAESEVDAPVNT
jgi:subtilisin family serine protease/subtilisin-like proprotein convertase family protein